MLHLNLKNKKTNFYYVIKSSKVLCIRGEIYSTCIEIDLFFFLKIIRKIIDNKGYKRNMSIQDMHGEIKISHKLDPTTTA